MGNHAFTAAFDHLVRVEHKDEPGFAGDSGRRYGLNQQDYPDRDIAKLTEAEAWEIHHCDYWRKAGCDGLPFALAVAVFDAAVMHSVHRAVVLLQQALGVVADGIYGVATQAAARACDVPETLLAFLSRRAVFLMDVAKADHSQMPSLPARMRRLFVLQQTILAHSGDAWDWEPAL